MSTSVTKRFNRSLKAYLGTSIFFFAFSRIYEHFSFGETSPYMHWLFLIPLLGGALFLLILRVFPTTSRLSMNLWNSTLAVLTTGALLRGIINLSGRSTTLDTPYYLIAICLAAFTIISMLFTRSTWEESIK